MPERIRRLQLRDPICLLEDKKVDKVHLRILLRWVQRDLITFQVSTHLFKRPKTKLAHPSTSEEIQRHPHPLLRTISQLVPVHLRPTLSMSLTSTRAAKTSVGIPTTWGAAWIQPLDSQPCLIATPWMILTSESPWQQLLTMKDFSRLTCEMKLQHLVMESKVAMLKSLMCHRQTLAYHLSNTVIINSIMHNINNIAVRMVIMQVVKLKAHTIKGIKPPAGLVSNRIRVNILIRTISKSEFLSM